MTNNRYRKADIMKIYDVYLLYSPECIRGWLAYIKTTSEPTMHVRVCAETGAKAKNKAITMANKEMKNLDIVKINYDSGFWAANKHAKLMELLSDLNK